MNSALRAALVEQRRVGEALHRLQGALTKIGGQGEDAVVNYNPKVPIEAAVVALQVVPLLQAMGWNSLGDDNGSPFIERYPEYKSRVIQTDLALLDRRGLPLVLIEVKRATGAKDHAAHQLWGYAREAARMGAMLRALILTDGVKWRVWPLRDRIDSTAEVHADIREESEWPTIESIVGREGLYATLDPIQLAKAPQPQRPIAPRLAWVDSSVGDEAFPRLGRVLNPTSKVAWVVTFVWDDAAQRRFAKAHPGREVSFQCPDCHRDMRLGHDCGEGPLLR